ncbi:hypothetical protein MFUR16E_04425 [Methylobacterium fujisawaense]|uniref:hypothetical protein n=1 Tax=Methylobacterium fujisawaense TaxID=107400 RepID=UPI002F315C12
MTAAAQALAVAQLLGRYRFRINTERALQDDIEEALQKEGVTFAREHQLPGAGIVDFMVGRVALEVKIGGSKRDIHRQCVRYCAHADVAALVLATSVAMGLPDIEKPTVVMSLGRAWL